MATDPLRNPSYLYQGKTWTGPIYDSTQNYMAVNTIGGGTQWFPGPSPLASDPIENPYWVDPRLPPGVAAQFMTVSPARFDAEPCPSCCHDHATSAMFCEWCRSGMCEWYCAVEDDVPFWINLNETGAKPDPVEFIYQYNEQ